MARTSVNNKYIGDSIQNVQTNQITISEDKLRIKLEKQIKCIKKGSGALGYFSVSATCFGVLVGSEFKEIFGITPDMWKTVFFLAAVVTFILFLVRAFNALFHKVTVDSIVRDMKTKDTSDMNSDLTFFNRWAYSKKNSNHGFYYDLDAGEEMK